MRWSTNVNQVHEMDAFVGDLVDALSEREERTVLVLYGDHLPALGLEGDDMESASLYRTEYIIWDNFGLEKEDEDLAAYQLSAAVLGRLGNHHRGDERLPPDLPGGAHLPEGSADAGVRRPSTALVGSTRRRGAMGLPTWRWAWCPSASPA